jgi:hypothetical protein
MATVKQALYATGLDNAEMEQIIDWLENQEICTVEMEVTESTVLVFPWISCTAEKWALFAANFYTHI